MANIASQKKRIARTERERLENRRYTSSVKTSLRRLEVAVEAHDVLVETAHVPVEVGCRGVELAHLPGERLHVLLQRRHAGAQLVLDLGELGGGLAQPGEVTLLLGEPPQRGGERVQIIHRLGHQAGRKG